MTAADLAFAKGTKMQAEKGMEAKAKEYFQLSEWCVKQRKASNRACLRAHGSTSYACDCGALGRVRLRSSRTAYLAEQVETRRQGCRG